MTMGQRILQARLDAGLSQRELAGDVITRNMLSSLEHDAANPSVSTLRYLSEKLCKPISYFLGEDQPQVDGYDALTAARQAYDTGAYRKCLELLAGRTPGQVLAREWNLLEILAALALAEQALAEGRKPYARELVEKARGKGDVHPYFTPELRRRAAILALRCGEAVAIPPEDDVLLLRAESALADGRPADAARYLNAAEDRSSPGWNHLMGEVHFARGEYREAADCYHRAEASIDLRSRLEICYRELEDFKMAYFYAKA